MLITDLGDPRGLEEEWRALEMRVGPPPYLCWDWMSAWLSAYAPENPAVVRVGDRAGPPIALGVIDRRRRGRWAFAGAPVSPATGLLTAEADRSLAWRSLGAELARQRGTWASLSFHGVHPDAAVLPGARLSEASWWVVELPGSFDEYLTQRSSAQRKAHKQKLRRLEKASAEVGVAGPDRHPEALEAFVELHALRAAAKGEHHPHMNAYLRALLERLSSAQTLRLRPVVLRVDGEIAGVSIRIDCGDAGGAWFYNAGIDPAHQRLGPGVVLELASIRDAIERGHRRFDLGPGFWRYKHDLGGREHVLFDGEAFSASPWGQLLRVLVVGRRAMRELPRRWTVRRAASSNAGSTAD